MHESLEKIRNNLNSVISKVQSTLPNDDPISIAHGNWSLPGLCRIDYIESAKALIQLIDDRGTDEVEVEAAKRITDFGRRLDFLIAHTIPQLWGGNGNHATSAYMQTLNGLHQALIPALKVSNDAEISSQRRRVTTKLRGLEDSLKSLEPRTISLAAMIARIEQAHVAADQLPTDLESLSEARQQIAELLKASIREKALLDGIKIEADKLDSDLKKSAKEAAGVLTKCETAYSAATSVGLAAAFTERSNALARSMWIWVGGLVIALLAGGYFGSTQLNSLAGLLKESNVSPSIVVLNLMLSLLSVGAPVWFGWLSTKQIGQRFRLAEDYAFKASISRAYEGFRREAARIDKDMEARLLASALTRLDELPLRLVETTTHGSPWHELASSDLVKDAMRAIPGFADQVKQLAAKTIKATSAAKSKTAPQPTTSSEVD